MNVLSGRKYVNYSYILKKYGTDIAELSRISMVFIQLRVMVFMSKHFSKHFSTSRNGSKISFLSLDMKLNFFGVFLFCFAFETPSKLFSILFSLFLLFGSDTYKHAYRKVVCIFLVNYSSKFPMKL